MKSKTYVLKDCGRDEYPGDGLRLIDTLNPNDKSDITTEILKSIGYKELRADDVIEIQVKVLRPSQVITYDEVIP